MKIAYTEALISPREFELDCFKKYDFFHCVNSFFILPLGNWKSNCKILDRQHKVK